MEVVAYRPNGLLKFEKPHVYHDYHDYSRSMRKNYCLIFYTQSYILLGSDIPQQLM